MARVLVKYEDYLPGEDAFLGDALVALVGHSAVAVCTLNSDGLAE